MPVQTEKQAIFEDDNKQETNFLSSGMKIMTVLSAAVGLVAGDVIGTYSSPACRANGGACGFVGFNNTDTGAYDGVVHNNTQQAPSSCVPCYESMGFWALGGAVAAASVVCAVQAARVYGPRIKNLFFSAKSDEETPILPKDKQLQYDEKNSPHYRL